jgi:hypothetical protein
MEVAQNPPLSSAQMESLQKLVKQFKDLVNRYQKSCIPPLADAVIAKSNVNVTNVSYSQPTSGAPSTSYGSVHSAPTTSVDTKSTHGETSAVANGSVVPSISSQKLPQPPSKPVSATVSKTETTKDSAAFPAAVSSRSVGATSFLFPPQQITPNLSWQCFHSILFYGVGKAPNDGSVGFALSVIFFFISLLLISIS